MTEQNALDPMSAAICALHHSPFKVVIATTGGGAGLQNKLWQKPGSSATLLDSALLPSGMPYDRFALIDLIGHEPEKYCSESTALWMASAAHRRARELMLRAGTDPRHAIGLGLTAALATATERKGSDRVFIATRTEAGLRVLSLVFPKGTVTREDQGAACDLLGVDAILRTAGIESPFTENALRDVSPLVVQGSLFDSPLFWPDGTRGQRDDLDEKRHILYPGSFDPLHYGHEQSAAQIERMTGKQVVYAITNAHPDKGIIPDAELLLRAEQLRWRAPVLFTSGDQFYVSKARCFPGFGMLIGADAVLGMLNKKYYGSIEDRDRILREMITLGTTLYVAGREVDGRFMTLEDIPIPPGFEKLFVPVSGRWDIRSRDLR